MGVQLLVCLRISREKFLMERFIGSDDIFALVGSGSFTFSSEEGEYTVGPNEGALFRRGVLYERRILSPVTMYFFRFRSDGPVFESDHIKFRDRGRIASTFAMLEALDRGVFKEDFALRRHLFGDILAQYALESGTPGSGAGKTDEAMAEAVAYINKNLHRKLSLSRVGERTGLSYVQFSRRFRAFTGMTPQDYVAALRLQKAKNLLADTDLLVRDIAAACGFENEYYFSNFFKKSMGISPSAYRSNAALP